MSSLFMTLYLHAVVPVESRLKAKKKAERQSMFKHLEYTFKVFEHKFKRLEHKFAALEHKILKKEAKDSSEEGERFPRRERTIPRKGTDYSQEGNRQRATGSSWPSKFECWCDSLPSLSLTYEKRLPNPIHVPH